MDRPAARKRRYQDERNVAGPLVDQLVACAVRDHNVDPRRIYTTGCSAGGLFAAALGAARSRYIAAVAPDSAACTEWRGVGRLSETP